MKRKSLLVAMASVSLAAIGIGATSTMAWFNASNAASANDNTVAETVAVTSAVKTQGIAFTPSVTVKPIYASSISGELDATQQATLESGTSLELVSYVTNVKPVDGTKTGDVIDDYTGFAFGFYQNGAVRYQKAQIGTGNYWVYYEVEVKLVNEKLNEIPYTAAQIEAELNAKTTYTVSVAHTDTSDTNNFALFYGGGETKPANKAGAAPSNAGVNSATISTTSSLKFTEAGKKFYFGLYIDGESHNTAHSASPDAANGNFTITVDATTAS